MVDVVIVENNMEKVSMRLLDKKERCNNFEEVALGYSKDEAFKEASRCLNCPNPRCVSGCPVGIEIPKFIEQIKLENIEEAYKIIRKSSLLPGICGRVCPQEKQCEGMCVKGFKGDAIAIGSLERYVADEARINNFKTNDSYESNGKKVAIVGSGPSGLSCAASLAKMGYSVTIYEALHKAGGVLTYGIPEFRLPKKIVDKEIDSLKELGVEIILNAIIGTTLTLDELKGEYDAIFIGSGAGLPNFMGIKNENAKGVFSANEILTRINLMGAYKEDSLTPIMEGKKVIVVGGGNVAIDAARSMRRLNRDVTICYRRSMDELPARREEVNHAIEEGIEFALLTNPKEIIIDDNDFVKGIKVVDMELVDNGEARKSAKEIRGSEHIIDCDIVIMAIGTTPNPTLVNNTDLLHDSHGLIEVDGTKTSDDKVFAGGDAVTGSATVILAMEAGKKAALEIDEYLN